MGDLRLTCGSLGLLLCGCGARALIRFLLLLLLLLLLQQLLLLILGEDVV